MVCDPDISVHVASSSVTDPRIAERSQAAAGDWFRQDETAIASVTRPMKDDGKDSFQKFTHLGQATDNQRLSCFGLSVH